MGFFDSWKTKLKTHLKHPVLFPGNVVEGYVEITASSNIDFSAIRVEAVGKELVKLKREEWRGDGEDRERVTEEYIEETVIYQQLVTLAGHMKMSGNRGSQVMPQGHYTYPFAFQLPTTLPPSFAKRADDDEADVMYFIRAYVDIPMARDAEDQVHFTVLTAMPATQWAAKQPATVDRSWDVTCCCCIGKGHVKARLWMDRTVIALNRDQLMVCADIDNTEGENPVESIEISLVNTLTYRARGIEERNRLVAGRTFIDNARVEPGQRGRINGVVPIPKDIIPSIATFNCTSIYHVDMELNIPMASDPCHTFPVMLTQCVDDSNFLPPVNFQQNMFRPWAQEQEFYYQPPPQPVFAYNPIPVPPPPQVPMIVFEPPRFQVMPSMSIGFAAPTVYGQPASGPAVDVAWTDGFTMQTMTTTTTTETVTENGMSVTMTTTTQGGGVDAPLLATEQVTYTPAEF